MSDQLNSAAQPLLGRTALVSGASSGIGRALAAALGAAGAAVCLLGRTPGRLQQAAAEALAAGAPLACPLALELTDDAAVRALPGRLPAPFRQLDVLVHAAGTVAHGLLSRHAVSELDRQYQLNVRAPYLLTQVLLPQLRPGPHSHVVFINSMAALISKAENGQYAATKAALKAVADSLRCELAPQGTRVLSVFPGKTDTPLLRQLCQADGEAYAPANYIPPAELARFVVEALCLPPAMLLHDLPVRSVRRIAAPEPVAAPDARLLFTPQPVVAP